MFSLSPLAFTVLLAVQAIPSPPLQAPKDKLLEIKGSKTPEAIPEWMVWRSAFRIIANRAENHGKLFDYSVFAKVKLAPEEKVAVFAAADAWKIQQATFLGFHRES